MTGAAKRSSAGEQSWRSLRSVAIAIFATATMVKVLCGPFYRSTDFDVHRNWLALTHSLSVRDWYFENTSEWTLDYPPFFAFFQLLLSYPARLFDPVMLQISASPYQSTLTVVYQRLTVIVADCLLFYAISQFVQARASWYESFTQSQRQLTLFTLCVCNPGLIVLDHLHFQYNGFLLSLFLLSVTAAMRDECLWSAFWFAVLLNFKHIFLYVAPVYFVYLLCHFCFRRDEHGAITGVAWMNFLSLASIVLAVFTASLGPFILWGQGAQLLARLFPFQRGLCHAYWAPNVWVFYNLADKVLIVLERRLGAELSAAASSSTSSGLVEDVAHVVLPTIKSGFTFVATLVTMAPVLYRLARHPKPAVFLSSLIYCSLCSFMLGWHVHEKAIMLTILPLGLCATDSVHDAKTFLFLSIVGHYSLFPLLFRSTETPLKCLLFAFFTALSIQLLANYHRKQQASRRIEYDGLFTDAEQLYLLGLAPLFVLTQWILPFALPAYAFLPLLLTSTYCALGCTYAWTLCWTAVTRRIKQSED